MGLLERSQHRRVQLVCTRRRGVQHVQGCDGMNLPARGANVVGTAWVRVFGDPFVGLVEEEPAGDADPFSDDAVGSILSLERGG